MEVPIETTVVELAELRNREPAFRDRKHAGVVLASMLADFRGADALVLAVPAGGVPVASEVARRLELSLDVAVVSKITLPWNTEAGYGAVAWDGTVRINHGLASRVGLEEDEVDAGVETTRGKVRRRVELFREDRPWPRIAGRPVILIDDGLASGFTMIVAVAALVAGGADRLFVAVPTAPEDTVARIAERVEAVYCANVREGLPFAVAAAYEIWSDVTEEEAAANLTGHWSTSP